MRTLVNVSVAMELDLTSPLAYPGICYRTQQVAAAGTLGRSTVHLVVCHCHKNGSRRACDSHVADAFCCRTVAFNSLPTDEEAGCRPGAITVNGKFQSQALNPAAFAPSGLHVVV